MKTFTLGALVATVCTLISVSSANAQCPPGQLEVTVDVITDGYGYEAYWELLPAGNACGFGTLFAGGNAAVGCGGGGAQNQFPGGYADNTVITEGPWCLTEGSDYTLEWVDDWGDGGINFTVNIAGLPLYDFSGTGSGNRWNFNVEAAPNLDAAMVDMVTPGFIPGGPTTVRVKVQNRGSDVINAVELSYAVDGGTPEFGTVPGLTLAPFEETVLSHPVEWNAVPGEYSFAVRVESVNGGADAVSSNNLTLKTITVVDPIPNIVDAYIWGGSTPMVIGTGADGLNIPRDLDFHPALDRKEVWVINKDTESSGGSTVTFRDAGETDQSADWRRDGNAWHFMSLPTGIAFSDNENFATSPGVYDANHGSGTPFTGPTLWSSDPDIYAMPSGGNGSHLDMLHVTPYGQGIAHEADNIFWLTDGNSNDVVRYDFMEDHGPGADYHGDGEVIRYPELPYSRISEHVPSHLVLDKENGWLYVVDGGDASVYRLDINSGTMGGSPAFPNLEAMAVYTNMTGVTWEYVATAGLVEPCGIELLENRLLVSDHATNEIIIYDLDDPGFVELGRIQTTAEEIMGIKIGPEGRIWYVDAARDELVRLDANATGIEAPALSGATVAPNPAPGQAMATFTPLYAGLAQLEVVDVLGRVHQRWEQDVAAGQAVSVPVSAEPGTYWLRITLGYTQQTLPWMVSR